MILFNDNGRGKKKTMEASKYVPCQGYEVIMMNDGLGRPGLLDSYCHYLCIYSKLYLILMSRVLILDGAENQKKSLLSKT